ncbi:hypothetical protein QBC39DRAFT_360520 [Podospora conica]|nr:hypothetical protein QBC39DRAFT_360520 [Schizothecium conicum]
MNDWRSFPALSLFRGWGAAVCVAACENEGVVVCQVWSVILRDLPGRVESSKSAAAPHHFRLFFFSLPPLCVLGFWASRRAVAMFLLLEFPLVKFPLVRFPLACENVSRSSHLYLLAGCFGKKRAVCFKKRGLVGFVVCVCVCVCVCVQSDRQGEEKKNNNNNHPNQTATSPLPLSSLPTLPTRYFSPPPKFENTRETPRGEGARNSDFQTSRASLLLVVLPLRPRFPPRPSNTTT